MNHQHAAAVAIEEWMTVSEQTDDQPRRLAQLSLVVRDTQPLFHSQTGVPRVREENPRLPDGNVWRRLRTVLASPWIQITEQNRVNAQEILVGNGLALKQEVNRIR